MVVLTRDSQGSILFHPLKPCILPSNKCIVVCLKGTFSWDVTVGSWRREEEIPAPASQSLHVCMAPPSEKVWKTSGGRQMSSNRCIFVGNIKSHRNNLLTFPAIIRWYTRAWILRSNRPQCKSVLLHCKYQTKSFSHSAILTCLKSQCCPDTW